MKKLFVLWALACFCVAAVHAVEVNDTTIMAQAQDTTLITSGEKVVIVTGDKPYHVKVVKKDKGLIERTESSKIVLTEDNRQVLND